ncbi:MAG: 3-dehydroquinate synthase [Pseudomonadota bacterium]
MANRIVLKFPQGHRCPILVDHCNVEALQSLWRPDWEDAAIIGDSNVIGLYGNDLAACLKQIAKRVALFDFPAGEKQKTRETKATLEDKLLTQSFGRRTCIVGFGGGVSLDLAGFVAATYMRGVPCLNVPTSLLAQVDASIGGKTGVNTEQGKNLVGAFHQPSGVLIDNTFLSTLPEQEWANGLAEIVKHAVVADRSLFDWIEKHVEELACAKSIDDYPLRRCVEIKGDIVQKDEYEHGIRCVLNFGHTVGHALEAGVGFTSGHGKAIALGMLVEGHVACEMCGFPPQDLEHIERILNSLGLLADLPRLGFDELCNFWGVDKKRKQNQLRMALPSRIGTMATQDQEYTLPVPIELLRQAWEKKQ